MESAMSGLAVLGSLLGLVYANLHARGATPRGRWHALLAPPLRLPCLVTGAALACRSSAPCRRTAPGRRGCGLAGACWGAPC